MRIGFNVHLSDENISGVEYYSLSLVRALLDAATDDELVVFTNTPGVVAEYLGTHRMLTVDKARYPKGRLFRILWEHARLRRAAERASLDVLHCPCYIRPAMTGGIPCVVTVHDTIALDHPGWCTWSNAAYYNLAMRTTLRNASIVVTVSDASRRALHRRALVDPARVRTVHPGVDDCFWKRCAPSERTAVRRKYSLPDEYVLHVGNIEPKKNLAVLLEAHGLLRDRGFGHALVLVGKRHWKSRRVFAAIRAGGRGRGVVLTGYVDRADLPAVYQSASLYICTSLYEGFGFPPLEAMASGVPVVSSDRGALRETLGSAARIADPTDPQTVADAAGLLLTDGALREEQIRLGLDRAREFDWAKTAARMLEIYREVLS